MQGISSAVLIWWVALAALAVINIALWWRGSSAAAGDDWYRRQRVLSGVYVFVCAFRSVLPRADVQRICLYDSWLSTVFVGRSVATVAELCFVAQIALFVRHLALRRASPVAVVLTRCAVPTIAVAEVCSWYAVLTRNYLGNACEESLWVVAAVEMLAACALVLWHDNVRRDRRALVPLIVLGTGYICFMLRVDVPMYVHRWQADVLAGKTLLPVVAGLSDLLHTRVVTYRFADWRTEMPWMTLYFSVAVWSSLALASFARVEDGVRHADGGNDSAGRGLAAMRTG